MKRVSGFNTRVSMEEADAPVVLGTPLEVEDLIEDQMATEEVNGLVVEMQNDLNALDEAHEAVDALQETQATIAEKLETPEAVTAEDVAIAQEALKLTAASLGVDLNSFNITTMSYESSKAYPSEALQVSMESIDDFLNTLSQNIHNLIVRVGLWIKKMIVKVMVMFNGASKKAEALLAEIKDKQDDAGAEFDVKIEYKIGHLLLAIAIANNKVVPDNAAEIVGFLTESTTNKTSLAAIKTANEVYKLAVDNEKEFSGIAYSFRSDAGDQAVENFAQKLLKLSGEGGNTVNESIRESLKKHLEQIAMRDKKSIDVGIGEPGLYKLYNNVHITPIRIDGDKFKCLTIFGLDIIKLKSPYSVTPENAKKAMKNAFTGYVTTINSSSTDAGAKKLTKANLIKVLNYIVSDGTKSIKSLSDSILKELSQTEAETNKLHALIAKDDVYVNKYGKKHSNMMLSALGKLAQNRIVSVSLDTILGAIGAHKAVLYYCMESAKLLK